MSDRRWALITGGTSGIGFGIAARLAEHFDLALSFAQNEDRAQTAVSLLKKSHPDTRVHIFQRPLKVPRDAANLYEDVVAKCGCSPSVLVNSAGRLEDGLFLSADFEKWISVVQEHLVVATALTQIALKAMYKEKWGRILNISSISGQFAKRGQTNYAIAKAGLEAFTRNLALEVAHRGVTVNAIAPGLIETPMTQEFIAGLEGTPGGIRARIPAGRTGRPEEVGALAAFLCSPEASYMTGGVIVIDGGRSLGDTTS